MVCRKWNKRGCLLVRMKSEEQALPFHFWFAEEGRGGRRKREGVGRHMCLIIIKQAIRHSVKNREKR